MLLSIFVQKLLHRYVVPNNLFYILVILTHATQVLLHLVLKINHDFPQSRKSLLNYDEKKNETNPNFNPGFTIHSGASKGIAGLRNVNYGKYVIRS
ncbi:hypothetical protein BACFRA24663_09075 [Bacteroides fragilis]